MTDGRSGDKGMLHHMAFVVFVALSCISDVVVLCQIQNDFHSNQNFFKDTIPKLFISLCKTKLKSHAHVERCTGMPNNTTHNTIAIQPLCSIGEPQIGRLTAHSSLSSLYSSAEERRCVGMWVNREMGGRGKPLLSPTPACIHFRIFPRCCRCSLPAFQLSSIPSPTPLSLLTISDVMWCDVRCQKIFWSKGLPQFS